MHRFSMKQMASIYARNKDYAPVPNPADDDEEEITLYVLLCIIMYCVNYYYV